MGGVSVCDREASIMSRPWPTEGGGGTATWWEIIHREQNLYDWFPGTPDLQKAESIIEKKNQLYVTASDAPRQSDKKKPLL